MSAGPGRGLFLTFEGVDGSGKTTQVRLLYDWLRGQGIPALRTREPGGTDLGRQIREIVLHRHEPISLRAEALLYAADRAHHVATLVRPALGRGEVVIQDRYLDSSIAYQAGGRDLDAADIRRLGLWAAEGLLPDLTVLLDVDERAVKARLAERTGFDRFEAEGAAFRARVRAAYLGLAQTEPARFLVLDGAASRDDIARAVQEKVSALLASRPAAASPAGDRR